MKNLYLSFLAVLLCFFAACSGSGPKDSVPYTSYDEMPAGTKFGVLQGSVQDIRLHESRPDFDIQIYSVYSDLLLALESGKVDYWLVDSASILNMDIEEHNFFICFVDNSLGGSCGFALPKGSTKLCNDMNAYLAKHYRTPEWNAMFNRWTSHNLDTVRMPDIPEGKGPELNVGLCTCNPPFDYLIGQEPGGFDVEVLRRFAAEMGYHVNFTFYDFSALLNAVPAHKIDLAAGDISITPERAKSVLFTDEYYRCNSICMGRRQSGVSKGSWWGNFKTSFRRNLIDEDRYMLLVKGLGKTLEITILATILGTILACGLCYLRMHRKKLWRNTAIVYIELMRGLPILIVLMLLFYVVFGQSSISPVMVAVIAFGLNTAAFMCEIFRSAIESIPVGQTEAGRALGFSKVKTFLYFIAPQALRQALPVYRSEVIGLLKNTSVVGYIAILDLTKMGDFIRSRTFDAFLPLIVVSVVYLIIAWIIGKLLDWLNNSLTSRRKVSA